MIAVAAKPPMAILIGEKPFFARWLSTCVECCGPGGVECPFTASASAIFTLPGPTILLSVKGKYLCVDVWFELVCVFFWISICNEMVFNWFLFVGCGVYGSCGKKEKDMGVVRRNTRRKTLCSVQVELLGLESLAFDKWWLTLKSSFKVLRSKETHHWIIVRPRFSVAEECSAWLWFNWITIYEFIYLLIIML